MAIISFDGQSFSLDGRRIWLVSGAIHYARVPYPLWRQRIQAAKQAGLNCIETPVFWGAHEPKPRCFDFKQDLDLRRFVQTIAEEGMFCILRPGPYVGSQWDGGGVPPWLWRVKHAKTREPVEVELRQSNPLFLEACSRYLTAVFDQVKDLQINATTGRLKETLPEGNLPGQAAGGFHHSMGGGPIVLAQIENQWCCYNEEQHQGYLGELTRYLRENGCTVPISSCNNLWQRVDGTIDTWKGSRHLAADMRQLAVVQPNSPRLVSEYGIGSVTHWGHPQKSNLDPDPHLYRLAGILSSGSQYNLHMFHGGTNFGFRAGRDIDGPANFVTTSHNSDAPLNEGGGRGSSYNVIKRISTFASQFGGIFAHLEPNAFGVTAAPTEKEHPLSIVHRQGGQGEVIFLLKSSKDKTRQVDVMLPEGLTLPIPLGSERVAWFVRNCNLGGVAELNYTNLRPWAFVDRKMLVLFGPAGAEGLLGLNDAQYQFKVPTGVEPLVEHQEQLTIVVLNNLQVDSAYLFEGGLATGCAGLDDAGQPLATCGKLPLRRIDTCGKITRTSKAGPGRVSAPKLESWHWAGSSTMLEGSDSYRDLDGPTSFERLGNDYGYGWYRVRLGSARSVRMLAPQAADRLHVYSNGKLQAVLGPGPGATEDPVTMRIGPDVVLLADNLGRYSSGQFIGEHKGLFGHLVAVRTVRLGKPKIISGPGPDPFLISQYVHGQRKTVQPASDTLVWKLKPVTRKPMILDIRGFPAQGVLMVNHQPYALYADPGQRYILTPGSNGFTGGQNTVALALYGRFNHKTNLSRYIKLYQVTDVLTAKSQWSFAPWCQPPQKEFVPLPGILEPQPSWFLSSFVAKDTSWPLWLEPRGMSKGQIYLNGHNVGRYFVNSRTGHAVGPQNRYYLPEPWLHTDQSNRLVLFDEHGRSPQKCRLLYAKTHK